MCRESKVCKTIFREILQTFRNNKLLNVKKLDKFWFKRNKFKIIILFISFDDDLRLLTKLRTFQTSDFSKSLTTRFRDFMISFLFSLEVWIFLRDMKSNVKCLYKVMSNVFLIERNLVFVLRENAYMQKKVKNIAESYLLWKQFAMQDSVIPGV